MSHPVRSVEERLTAWEPLITELGTPLLVLCLNDVAGSVSRLRALDPSLRLCLPCKTIGLRRFSSEIVALFDLFLASGVRHGKALLQAGISPGNLILGGAGRGTDDFAWGLENGIGRFVLDSSREVDAFRGVARSSGATCGLSLRVSSAGQDPGGYERFGLPLGEAVKALPQLCEATSGPVGFAYHGEASASDPEKWTIPRLRIIQALAEISAGNNSKEINLGGGVPAKSQRDCRLFDFFDSTKCYSGVRRIVELGRGLFADSGYVVARVQEVKRKNGKRWVFIDAGSNLLIPLESSRFRVAGGGAEPFEECYVADCHSMFGMIPGKALLSNKLDRGDLVIVEGAGAYTWSMRCHAIWGVGSAVVIDGSGRVLSVEKNEGFCG